MTKPYSIYWGDTHHNTYQHYRQDPPLDEVLAFASTHLDFYTGAYYTQVFDEIPLKTNVDDTRIKPQGGHPVEILAAANRQWSGVRLERPKDPAMIVQEWAEFQAVTAQWNRPGQFVAFPGYEWQGNSHWGDHNVVYQTEGPPVYMVDTIDELYGRLRGQKAIAIPHHTAYLVGQRAPRWSHCDERLSPFAELYSIHGSSESDEEWVGLRHNPHMGPGVGGGTYQDALDRGLHLGAICSTDNWTNMPGHWNQGLMACLATELTRESLWEAFRTRRVYGVTGDRIQLDFTCNGAPMGTILPYCETREIEVQVQGSDAIDRIELLRNGQVIATHCHQGTWQSPAMDQQTRFKIRIEPGWGPHPGEVPLPTQQWHGQLSIDQGRIVGWEPCWVTRGQQVPDISEKCARFEMVTSQEYTNRESAGAIIFEFESTPSACLTLEINGQTIQQPVAAFAQRSHLLWFYDEAVELLAAMTDVDHALAQQSDLYYHMAGKAKIHRAIPQSGYQATLHLVDDVQGDHASTHYRVRIEQRNGQRAWSSPIWFQQIGEGTNDS